MGFELRGTTTITWGLAVLCIRTIAEIWRVQHPPSEKQTLNKRYSEICNSAIWDSKHYYVNRSTTRKKLYPY
eukprot:scaffold13358_cov198-Alexandrium_tamarense.AAC.26